MPPMIKDKPMPTKTPLEYTPIALPNRAGLKRSDNREYAAGDSAASPTPTAAEKAAAYLKAKQATQQPVSTAASARVQDAQAALLASKGAAAGGPKAAAAAKYLEMRRKQKAAEAYLEEKRVKRGQQAERSKNDE